MNEEELKAGERYNFTLLYTGQSINNKFRFESPTGIHYILGLGDMEAVSPLSAPENGIKNTETAPKYDPCRLFKTGDEVRPIVKNGRIFSLYWKQYIGKTLIVTKGEDSLGAPEVNGQPIDPAYLELVTPVEELEPYIVRHNEAHAAWSIYVPFGLSAVNYFYGERYPYTKESAKAAAEAECARLNAEYRKEQA